MKNLIKFYWIDDNKGRMGSVIEAFFPHLWCMNDKKISVISKIFLFGDAYRDEDHSKDFELTEDNREEERQQCEAQIVRTFNRFCHKLDKSKNTKDSKEKNRHLIEGASGELNVCELIKSTTDTRTLQDKLKTIEPSSKILQDVLSLVDKVIDTLPIDAANDSTVVIALDMLLLQGDHTRLAKNSPILSMVLHKILSKRGYFCFIYSTAGNDKETINLWKAVYEKSLDVTNAIPNSVFSRDSMTEHPQKTAEEIIEKFLNHYKA
jgi:hypothetical protein